ncbi:MAG: S26 family signal peptidase [Alphaproteobacteria bacterium]|nr:S26 family signal peptidase [Methylococcaceae bacterium]MDP3936118.1 S26 family signal peptidase [Alphaproteobacteria bacterium]
MKHTIKRFLWIGLFLSSLILISRFMIVRWNLSNSLPGRMFIGTTWSFTPQRGDIVSFDHPMFPAPIAKVVVGVAGDFVDILSGHAIVNGSDRGIILDKSPRSGKPLTPIEHGLIPDDYVYVWAPHPESFDSRYADIGLIHLSRIKERLWCVF